MGGPGQRKTGFMRNLSTPGVSGRLGCVAPLWKEEDGVNKMLGVEFLIFARAGKKTARNSGLVLVASKILEFGLFP